MKIKSIEDYEKMLIQIEKRIKELIENEDKKKKRRYYNTKKLYSSFENLECRKNDKIKYIKYSKKQGLDLALKAREINLATNFNSIPYYQFNKLKEDYLNKHLNIKNMEA